MKRVKVAGIGRLRHWIKDGTLVIDLGRTMRVLSSAPCGGGLGSTRYILNHQVATNPAPLNAKRTDLVSRHPRPATTLRSVAMRLGVKESCVGLMTAVPMTQLVAGREESHGMWVECFATVGVTNAVRAGEPVSGSLADSQTAGTINIILVTNAALVHAAMVGAVQVVTESKTGALRDRAVPSWTGMVGATGTGTDAVVIACAARSKGPKVAYSGTHTEMGAMIGRVVERCILDGLSLAVQWTNQTNRSSNRI